MKPVHTTTDNTRRRWIAAIGYTLLIFLFLPIFPSLWGPVSRQFPEILRGINYGFISLLAILFTGLLLFHKKQGPGFYILSTAVFFGYGLFVFFVCQYPAERFHLLEYGVLVILVYRALVPRIRTPRIYFFIILYTFAVGLMDELIQALLPNRVYDNRDIAINWGASLLATGLLGAATWKRFGMMKSGDIPARAKKGESE